jgi:hypothetical protein
MSTFADLVYSQLPQYIQDDDAPAGALRRYLSTITDQGTELEVLFDRINHLALDEGGQPGDLSELVDPRVADPQWLPWLAQLVGANVTGLVDVQARRDAITYASNGWRAGTRDAVAQAAMSALTGGRYVSVYDHSISTPGDGGQWDVLLVTRASETPSAPAVLQAVIDKAAKPAGVVLHHRVYTATWSTMLAASPTWADRNGLPWSTLEEVGL